MLKILNIKVKRVFSQWHDRTKNITKHIFLSFLYKGGSILTSFLLVPITIRYLNVENYGIWLTLSSFITWFSFFDIGLGNGLRNKFSEAKAKGDLKLMKAYVSSAYFTIGTASFLLILIFWGLNSYINWEAIFNTTSISNSDMSTLMLIIFSFFCLRLTATLITTIYIADQNYSMQGKINFIINVGALLLIWFITVTAKSSLLIFGTIFSALPVVILTCLNFYAFSNTYKDFKPSITLWKKKYLKDIFGLGVTFFILQVSGTILYSTDNFIISHFFSPSEVVPYNISYKYFSISTMIFSIIAEPYWSGITDAYHKNDFEWITKSMAFFRKLIVLFLLLLIVMAAGSYLFYYIWVGNMVTIPLQLNLLMCLFFMLSIYVTPYTFFLNGTGKIKLQAFQAMLAALLNIPICIILIQYFHMGTAGVILGTIICFIPGAILCPIQYRKIIQKRATGIWDR